MSGTPRIYLDNAATSWPKPESVYLATDRYQREIGAAAGRGGHVEAIAAREIVEATRRDVAHWIGARDPRHLIFAFNGTDALNIAIHGALADGGHVVTTVIEHNSVLRPLATLEDAGRIVVTRVPCDSDGLIDPAEVRRALRADTRLVVMSHASNVTGAIQPAAEVGQIVRDHDALFLLDAAQTVGEMPLDVEHLQVDLLAAPGHKGLLGPLGTGLLYIRPTVAERLPSFRQGGTGSHSERDRQPDELPDKYEAGNLNVPGIAGLGAGVRWLAEQGIDSIRDRGVVLTRQMLAGLSAIDGVRVHGPATAEARVAVVSVTLKGYDPQELATMLDTAFCVQPRAGLHCAPQMHQALGTAAWGGTVRFSLGPMNTESDVETAVTAMTEIATQTPVR
jgi:cysteine desulfurase/selenocysteine lyase